MVNEAMPPKYAKSMIRFVPLLLLASACALWADLACAQNTPSDLVTRLDRLEETVRNLTGQIEQLQYRNQQLEQQLQGLQAQPPGSAPQLQGSAPQLQGSARVSTALPPPTASQYSPPPPPPPAPAAPSTPPAYTPPPAPVIANAPAPAPPVDAGPASGQSGHDAFNPALHPTAPGAPRPLGTSTTATEPPVPDASRQAGAPLQLSNLGAAQGATAAAGGLPPPPPANPNATGAVQEAALPPNATPKDAYDLGYGYVLQKNYPLAAQTFRDFLEKYPRDRLTAEAQYWLGESLFQEQQYRDAAEAFLAVSTKYETSGHAPEALLRLGESLAALGEKEAACASLGEVLRKYPHASLSVKQNVDRDQKRVHC